MDELKTLLKTALADTFLMYFKAHSFHWNVEGVHFSQYHDFFSDLYKDLHSAVDPMAEELRALDVYAPMNLTEVYSSKTVSENTDVYGSNVYEMLRSLYVDNSSIINTLNKLFAVASEQNEQGIADFVAGRIDVHKKHAWMLRASMKK